MSAAYRNLPRPDSLTVFSYVWAAQTLCQLAVFRSWLREGHVTAWVLLLIAVLVLLFPGRLRLFLVMLLASVVHYVSVWPFVSNHVLVDTILTLTMLTGHRLLDTRAYRQGRAGGDIQRVRACLLRDIHIHILLDNHIEAEFGFLRSRHQLHVDDIWQFRQKQAAFR